MTRQELFDLLVERDEMRRGTITGFRGSWMSGLGYLLIDGVGVPCDNAPTVRAIDGCFGDVIAEGHTVNQKVIVGKEIYYSMDGFVLGGFTPVDDLKMQSEVDPDDFGIQTSVDKEVD
jgi:hypothetical protein